MSDEIQLGKFWNKLPLVVDPKRLTELEAMSRQQDMLFYTFEVTSSGGVNVLYQGTPMLSRCIRGEPGVALNQVLDYAFDDLRKHIHQTVSTRNGESGNE